jgi:hypothetical protein
LPRQHNSLAAEPAQPTRLTCTTSRVVCHGGAEANRGEQPGTTPIRPLLLERSHAIACSITGGFATHGKKLPELRGAYVFGDWETRRRWAARFPGDQTKEMPEMARPFMRSVASAQDNRGEL